MLPPWIEILSAPKSYPIEALEAELDAGETAAIALFLKEKADALLIDEKIGRNVAIKLGFRTVGILGILTDAKNHNLISSVKILMDRLENEANFWISRDLRLQVLQLAGE
jgi:predicted nucleic acid-binding protein